MSSRPMLLVAFITAETIDLAKKNPSTQNYDIQTKTKNVLYFDGMNAKASWLLKLTQDVESSDVNKSIELLLSQPIARNNAVS